MTGDPIRESAAAAGAHRSTPVLVLVARVGGTVLRITLIGYLRLAARFRSGQAGVEVFGRGSHIGCPQVLAWLNSGVRLAGHRDEEWLQRGVTGSRYHDADLAVASLRMAAAVRGGTVAGVISTDQGREYTSTQFGAACRSLGITQSTGQVGSALDNAAAESSFSTLEHELLSRRQLATRDEARRVVAGWIDGFPALRLVAHAGGGREDDVHG
jgi:Integrase core domain